MLVAVVAVFVVVAVVVGVIKNSFCLRLALLESLLAK